MARQSRAERRVLFEEAVTALGRREMDRFEAFFTPDAIFEFPCLEVTRHPPMLQGAAKFRRHLEAVLSGCSLAVEGAFKFYEVMTADTLISEYQSEIRSADLVGPLAMHHLAVVRFQRGRICFWKEYCKPAGVLSQEAAAPVLRARHSEPHGAFSFR